MAIMIDPRRGGRVSVKKSEASQRVLDALDKYIEGNFSEPMKWIVGLWRDQATVLTYGELMSIVTDEDLPKKIFDDWFGDYSRFIAQKITPMWQEAMIAAVKDNPLFADVGEGFDTADYYVRDWMTTRSANLVTACLDEQRQAIRYIISEGKANKWSTSETARYIRPTIGLTEQQAAANQKYYNTVKEQTRENHPRMTDEAVERKAREAAGRYAARQQRTRAETIARTEMATAYNEGNDQYVRQAMRRGQMPRMVKVWSTADDGHVCSACEDLEGVEVGMDDEFKVTVGKRVHREVATLLPPLHPRCKCAIMYEETGDIAEEDEMYNKRNDPLLDVLGPISESNPEEMEAMMKEAEESGCELKLNASGIGYSPGINPGEPGQLHTSPEDSYGAWLHEMRHLRDDKADGWGGFRGMFDVERRTRMEYNAYREELAIARALNRPDIVESLKQMCRVEVDHFGGIWDEAELDK